MTCAWVLEPSTGEEKELRKYRHTTMLGLPGVLLSPQPRTSAFTRHSTEGLLHFSLSEVSVDKQPQDVSVGGESCSC